MDCTMLKVVSNVEIQEDIYALTLEGDFSQITNPGQFVNIKIDDCFLRRPISICHYSDRLITLLYKLVGRGTALLSKKQPGDKLDVIYPLGNGFDLNKEFTAPLLIGGGIGVPPLYQLAKELVTIGKKPTILLGFNSINQVILVDEFEKLGLQVKVATVDGSYGHKGFVTDLCKDLSYDYAFTCGPEPMLKAVYDVVPDGQFSFEARMACGFGACMGCTCKTKYGNKRICKDGPVLFKEEIIW